MHSKPLLIQKQRRRETVVGVLDFFGELLITEGGVPVSFQTVGSGLNGRRAEKLAAVHVRSTAPTKKL